MVYQLALHSIQSTTPSKLYGCDEYSFQRKGLSLISSNMSSNRLNRIAFYDMKCRKVLVWQGGGNMGSNPIRKAFSSMFGIILESNVHSVSKHGLVLISIRLTSNLELIMKSNPNTSKLFMCFYLFRNKAVDRIASSAIVYITQSLPSFSGDTRCRSCACSLCSLDTFENQHN